MSQAVDELWTVAGTAPHVDATTSSMKCRPSLRTKDRADLNALVSQLDREKIVRRVRESTSGLRGDARLLDASTQNWYVLFGQPLPE